MEKRLARIAAVAAILLGACTATDDSTDEPTIDVFGEDGSGDRLVLVVDDEGGLTQGDYILAFPPMYSIYADGSMYFAHHTPTDPPFLPLLKAIAVAQLTESQLATVASMVKEMELPDIDSETDSSRRSTVLDDTTTRATYFDSGGLAHSFGVYSLRGDQEVGTKNEVLANLRTELTNIAANADLAELRADRLEVTWRKQRRGDPAEALPWPVSTAPADFGEKADSGTRCIVLEGTEALATAELFTEVSWESLFTDGETVYRVIGRNLLPSEPGCT